MGALGCHGPTPPFSSGTSKVNPAWINLVCQTTPTGGQNNFLLSQCVHMQKTMSDSIVFLPDLTSDDMYSHMSSFNRWLSRWRPSNNVGFVDGSSGEVLIWLGRHGMHPSLDLISRNLTKFIRQPKPWQPSVETRRQSYMLLCASIRAVTHPKPHRDWICPQPAKFI